MIKRLLRNYKTYLLLIIVFAGMLRFYEINKIPASLYWDEVSQGYNAYSISQTLKDEYGVFMPVLFKAFDDYKMPLNIYLIAVFVKAFGLNEFAVRFPSAFLGTLTVLITFFLTEELLKKSKWQMLKKHENAIPLLSAFFLAISPWHIQFSRAGFEANISLFFITLGAYIFFKGLENYKFYILSIISFALACYGYRSVEIFLPVLLISFFIIWKKELLKLGKLKISIGILLFLLLTIPMLISLIGKGSTRFNQTNITNKVDEIQLTDFQKGINVNRKILYGKIFLQNYIAEFNPQFLFFSGDPNGRQSPRGMGLLYVWELPFLLIGLYVLLRQFPFPVKSSIIVWLLAAPLPAALSIPIPHALRSLNILPMPQVLTAIGVFYIFLLLNKNMQKIYAVVLVAIIVAFFVRYTNLYIYTNTKSNVADWADGYRQLTQYVFANEKSYDKVLITGHDWEPYIYFLFYSKYNPKAYQESGTSNGFGKYVFGGTSWDKDKNSQELGDVNPREYAGTDKKLLIALSPEEYRGQKDNINKLADIKNHAGKIVFIIGSAK